MRYLPLATAALVFGAASSLAGRAGATSCTTLTNPVYAAGSTAIKGVLGQVAAFLTGPTQTTPVTIVYLGSGSCNGVDAVIDAVSAAPTPLQTPSGQTDYFTYWDSTGATHTCDLAASDNAYLDIGLSDVFATTCPGVQNFSVTDFPGPVQAMTFIVPNGSMEYSISAEAAFFVFGFGSKSSVDPWTNVSYLHQRGSGSGTQAMIAKAITVPATAWYGNIETSTGNMINALLTANMPLAPQQKGSLGIAAAEDIDAQRRKVLQGTATDTPRELAYKHFGQNCGYLPDSAGDTFDKRNVRDGHYAIWGPVHTYPVLSASKPQTQKSYINSVVGLLTGSTTTSGIDLITFEANNGIIPQCAMRVTRSQEMGPMTAASPANPCGCYYEHIANKPASKDTSCTPCQKPTDCGTGFGCSTINGVGYCEPQ